MSESKPTLVTGATGSTGRAVAESLIALGVPVAAMARKPDDRARMPAEVSAVVVADFDDDDSLCRALAGVERTYLVTPSSERAEAQQLRFVDRAVEAGVEQIVLLSQLAAAVDSPVRFLRYHAVVEEHIRQCGIGYTFLRPNLFFQGLLAFSGSIAADGRFGAPIGEARVSAVDVRDIGAVAAAALTDTGHIGQTYTLTGPAAITHADMAEAIGTARGRAVSFDDATVEDFARALDGVLPPWQIDGLLEDYAHYRSGEASAVTDSVRTVTGREPRGIDDFAADFADRFR